jgi:hypothetical protein
MSTGFIFPDWLPREPTPSSPPPDDHRVEGLVNRFIAAKQATLFDAPDAFYRLEGGDAVEGEPAITQRLQDLRTAALDLARDQGERDALGPRLDAHIDEAMDGIGRHVAAQHKVFQRNTLTARQALIRRAAELEPNNDDKITGLAEAHASAAQELARLDGIAPGSPVEAARLNEARSEILRTAISERIGAAKNAQALALFERMKDTLTPADRRALEVPIGVAADEATTDDWLKREGGKDGAPLVERIGLDRLSDMQRHILRAKIAARESAAESRRFATVKELDDKLAKATAMIATQPSAHPIGTLARLAAAYDAAGAPEQAAETRRLALLEPFFVPFAQLGIAVQQRHLENLTGPERAFAEAILRHQVETRDRYTLGVPVAPSSAEKDAVVPVRYEPGMNERSRVLMPGGEGPILKPDADSSGHIVQLPDGSLIPNPFPGPRNRAGFVIAPVDDLNDVAAAGQRDGQRFRELKKSKWTYNQADAFFIAQFMANVGTGGRFDHQRSGNFLLGFEQLRHFRPIANVNVGLYCQQFRLSLEDTLKLAGLYASWFSSNPDPKRPSGLDEQTEHFIREGYRIGQTGMFSTKEDNKADDSNHR